MNHADRQTQCDTFVKTVEKVDTHPQATFL